MCFDFPGRVTSCDGDVATVQIEGRTRRASTLLIPDVQVGEWVYVAAGTIVDRISAVTAQEITAELRRAKEIQA